jgi:glucokinase
MTTSTILAGDVGGTKIYLGLFEDDGKELRLAREASFPTAQAGGLEEVVDRFLAQDRARLGAVAFGFAGPIQEGVAWMTNVPWPVNGPALAGHLGLKRVGMLNDMEAMGYGALALPPDRFAVLNPGRPDPDGNGVLIAAGTGLGEAILAAGGNASDGGGLGGDGDWRPLPSEGGHASFAPEGPLQEELLAWLRARLHGHVSWERVLSGPGLVGIYKFLRETGRGEDDDRVARRMEAEDPAPVISELALAGQSPLCEQALATFVAIYGAEAGNLALTGLATGGVYLGGGIASKILPALQLPIFMEAFTAKGRLAGLLRAMPVKVMLDPKAPLYGAARYARRLAT